MQAFSPTTTPSSKISAPTLPSIDWLKVAHGIGYFCLGFSVLYALPRHSGWSPSVALILCCLYSFTDEFHQIFTPGRSASPRDILLDTLTALAGVAVRLGVMAFGASFNQVKESQQEVVLMDVGASHFSSQVPKSNTHRKVIMPQT